jgi:signal transduction histidine kinase
MSYVPGQADELRQACHDIRQPIAGVLALAGAALTEAGLSEKARDYLSKIVGLAEWQSDVIEHWLRAPGAWPSLLWPPGPVFVGVPRVTMRRIAANMLANATRAAGPSGRVTVEVSTRAMWMLLAVEDDGPGFGRISQNFGLGLSAVAREAIAHRGRLECGRGRLGGARVNLWLPAVAPQMGGRMEDAARAL